jgi:glycogen debranching enzyme
LNTISTLPNFDGKTSKGITLNSSLKDIEAAYGKPVVAPNRTKDNAKAWSYDEGVIFWIKRSRFLKRFQGIEKIVIFNNSWRRSYKGK